MYRAALLFALTAAGPALAQQTELPLAPARAPTEPVAPTTDEDDPYGEATEVDEIVVTGQRARGAVLGDIAPEITLDTADVRALGAASITELLEFLAPQLTSGRGRGGGAPVTLLNGRRISGFSEIRAIPPEAIERVEILPEEVALKYGYRADQRVVNIVLRPRFRSTTVELQGGGSTAGGGESIGVDAGILRLNRQGRSSIDVELRHVEPLLESERDILADVAPVGLVDLGASDTRPFRSLINASDRLSVNGTINRIVREDVSATLNARLDLSQGEALFGLPTAVLSGFRFLDAVRPLIRETEGQTGHLGVALDGRLADWRWSLTGNFDLVNSVSESGAGLDTTTLVSASDLATLPLLPADRGESTSNLGNAALVFNGTLFELPAGAISATVKVEAEALRFESASFRAGVTREADLGRDRGSVAISVDAPLIDRGDGPLGGLGDLSLNANVERDELSDFGGLTTIGFGLNWSPVSRLDLIASVTDENAAPTVQQLGDPVLLSPNARVFDFTRGETVDVARLSGGNPLLSADNRRVLKLGGTLKPFDERDLTLTLNYTANRIENPISSFPAITAEIEAAFPDRLVRDGSGALVQLDARPVNFAQSDREEVRWGLNYSRRIGPEVPPPTFGAGRGGAAGRRAQVPAPGRKGGREPEVRAALAGAARVAEASADPRKVGSSSACSTPIGSPIPF